jgi:hypothetical protein
VGLVLPTELVAALFVQAAQSERFGIGVAELRVCAADGSAVGAVIVRWCAPRLEQATIEEIRWDARRLSSDAPIWRAVVQLSGVRVPR